MNHQQLRSKLDKLRSKTESHSDFDEDEEDESVGDVSCFKPPFNSIKFPDKDQAYDQGDLNSFLFKRLDHLLVSKNKEMDEEDLLKLRFKNFRSLKKAESFIVEQVNK